MPKVLLVEDDVSVAQLLEFTLEAERFVLDHCTNCEEALLALRVSEYDVLIFDWALPDGTGLDLCKRYRSNGGNRPVLMLTARESPRDKVTALSAGADDYVVKPFDPDELIARLKALLRRPPVITEAVLKVASVQLDTTNFKCSKGDRAIPLQPKEFAILQLLMENPERYFTADAILVRVWRSDSSASTDSVRTHMKTLRKKLQDTADETVIENTRGLGYKMKTSE